MTITDTGQSIETNRGWDGSSHEDQPAFRKVRSERIGWVDHAKGIGIFLVVLGHVLYGMVHASLPVPRYTEYACNWIYGFHIPLFFVLSGLFVARSMHKGVKRFLFDKLRVIAYCYVLWAILHGTLQIAASSYTNYHLTWSFLLRMWFEPFGVYWFLYVLFFIHLLFAILHCMGFRKGGMLVLAVILSAVVTTCGAEISSPLDQIGYYFLFFAFGAWTAERRYDFIKGRGDAMLLALAILFVCLYSFSVGTYFTPHDWLRHATRALLGIAATVLFASFLERRGWCRFLRNWGAMSLQIYVMHTIFSAAWRIFWQKGAGVDSMPVHLVGGVVVGLILPLLVQHVASTLRFPYLFELPLPPSLGHGLREHVPISQCRSTRRQ